MSLSDVIARLRGLLCSALVSITHTKLYFCLVARPAVMAITPAG